MLQRRARPNKHLPVDANSVGLSIKYHNQCSMHASTPGGPHRKRTSSAVDTRAFAAPMSLMICNTRSCGVRL